MFRTLLPKDLGFLLEWPAVLASILAFLVWLSVNIGSTLYIYFHPIPVQYKDTFYELALSICFDAFIPILFLTLGIMFLGSHRSLKSAQSKIEELTKTVTALSDLPKNAVTQIEKSLDGLAQSSLLAWSIAAHDNQVRSMLADILGALDHKLNGRLEAEKVIARSLLRGLSVRFEAHTRFIHERGAIMDVEERRHLTEELYNSTNSYVVIFLGATSISTGALRWHSEYINFLKKIAHDNPENVAAIVADPMTIGELQNHGLVNELTTLGVRTYILGDVNNQLRGKFNADKVSRFGIAGPLFELFGRKISNEMRKEPANREIQTADGLCWKATSFAYRLPQGGVTHLSIADACNRAGNLAEDEGIWSIDDISKLVRAGSTGDDEQHIWGILLDICKRAQRVTSLTTHALQL